MRETRLQARKNHPQAIPYPEVAELRNPPLWALCAAGTLLAAFCGIAAGVGWLIVTHGAKVLGRLGF
jgi:hypothetical protein